MKDDGDVRPRFPPDDPREWLRSAGEDLTVAAAEIAGVGYELRAFHTQQAAEKAVKAVCIARGVVFPFTHDLDRLLAVLAADGVDTSRVAGAARLNGFATSMRYPARRRLDAVAFGAALSLARSIVAWATPLATSGPRRVLETTRRFYDATPPACGAEPDPALLAQVVTRIVDAVAPQRIILFGSAARGTMHPHSDLDLLIVMAQPDARGYVEAAIRRALRALDVAADVVIATPEDLERYGRSIGLVYRPALEEGRELYRIGAQA